MGLGWWLRALEIGNLEILILILGEAKNGKLKNIHQLTNNLARNQQVNIILTTNNDPNTGLGEEEDESDHELQGNPDDSWSTNDSVFDKEDGSPDGGNLDNLESQNKNDGDVISPFKDPDVTKFFDFIAQ